MGQDTLIVSDNTSFPSFILDERNTIIPESSVTSLGLYVKPIYD